MKIKLGEVEYSSKFNGGDRVVCVDKGGFISGWEGKVIDVRAPYIALNNIPLGDFQVKIDWGDGDTSMFLNESRFEIVGGVS